MWPDCIVIGHPVFCQNLYFVHVAKDFPKRDRYDVLVILTNNAALIWKEARGIAPDSAADKLDDAILEWQSELTKTLKIWIEKGLTMTTGELILACANLGAVVESWLNFFIVFIMKIIARTQLQIIKVK